MTIYASRCFKNGVLSIRVAFNPKINHNTAGHTSTILAPNSRLMKITATSYFEKLYA